MSDRLNRTVYLESVADETDDEDKLSASVVNLGSSATVVDESDQETGADVFGEDQSDAKEFQLIPYRVEVDIISLVENVSSASDEQAQLPERAEVELENLSLIHI